MDFFRSYERSPIYKVNEMIPINIQKPSGPKIIEPEDIKKNPIHSSKEQEES